jgi:hypothetical protein
MAGITDDSLRAVGASVAAQVKQLLTGALPEHLVNRQHAPEILLHIQKTLQNELQN